MRNDRAEMMAFWKDAQVMFWTVAVLLAANAGFITYSVQGRKLAVGLLVVYLMIGGGALGLVRRAVRPVRRRRTCAAAKSTV